MERNLLEREIAALRGTENFFSFPPWFATPKVAAPTIYQTKLRGKVTEPSFLRQADLKTKQKTNGKYIYYPPNQWVDILGEKGEWFLVEGTAVYMDGRKETPYPTTIQGWIEKAWVIYQPPTKTSGETVQGGDTYYVEIDLNLKADRDNKAWRVDKTQDYKAIKWVEDFPKPETAIFVPDGFKPEQETDIIIYLHGHLMDIPGLKELGGGRYNSRSIQEYLNYSAKDYLRFRESVSQFTKQSGKNVVFVAPTLGPRSQYGNLARNFDKYVEQIIWAVNEYFYKARNLKGQLNLRNLIIAAHSGGGSAMLRIAEQSKSTYAQRIKSFWGFDSWYNGSARWNKIVDDLTNNKKAVTIYAYKYNSGGTPKEAPTIVFVTAAANDQELLKVAKAGADLHFPLLPFYFKKRLESL